MRFVWMATVVGALMSSGAFAQGSEFPSKPIRVIVGFAAGSGADSTARLVAEQMQRMLGQPVLVDNKPGASGAIAVQHVKAQPADGHTILLASYSPMSVNPIVMKHPGYDPVTDFKAVHGLVRSATAWFVANESPYRTIGDLIAAGKRKPLTIGSYGAGYQLSIAWLANLSGSQLSYLPYKGQGQVVTDVMGGQIDAGAGDLGGVMALIQSGKLRALAVASDKRVTALPGVPTIMETEPGYEKYGWTSLFVRAETPPAAHAKLVDAVKKAMASRETLDYLEARNSMALNLGPEEMARYLRDEIARFRRVAEAAGIKPE